MKKRVMAFLLSACLMLCLLPSNVLVMTTAGEEDPEPEVALAKTAAEVTGAPGEYEITLKVQGKDIEAQEYQRTDVIVVMDVTGSLYGNLETEKAAVKKLLNTLFVSEDIPVRVALVQFTDYRYGETKFLNSKTVNGSYFYTYKNRADALAEIDAIPDYANAKGSTNIQLGLRMAEKIIQSNECKESKPVVMLITDGAPNRALNLVPDSVNSLTYYPADTSHASNAYLHNSLPGSIGNQTGGNIGSYSGNPDDANAAYFASFPNEDLSKYQKFELGTMNFVDPFTDNGNLNYAKDKDGNVTDYATVERSGYSNVSKSGSPKINWICGKEGKTTSKSGANSIGIIQQTYYESLLLKSMGAEVYTVSVKLKNKQVKTLIQMMATPDEPGATESHYANIADFNVLVDTVATMSETIKRSITNVKVYDPMGSHVTLVVEAGDEGATWTTKLEDYQKGDYDVYISRGTLAYEKKNNVDTLTWTVGDLEYGEEEEMRYKVKVKEGEVGKDIPLNGDAVVSYTDKDGEDKEEYYDKPTIDILAANYTVKHWQQNLADDQYTLVEADTETLSGEAGGTTAAVAKTYTGFTAQSFNQTTIGEDGKTVVNIYYNRDLKGYTVKYLETGTNAVVKTAKTGTARFGATLNETAPTIPGYAYQSATPTDHKITIGTDESKNVITFYYAQVLGDLKVTKTGCNETADKNQSFIFHITSTSLENTAHAAVDLFATVQGNGSVTVKDLPVGTYTVEEVSSWSWRYTSDGVKTVTVTDKGGSTTIKNTRKKTGGLSGSDYAVNTASGRKDR